MPNSISPDQAQSGDYEAMIDNTRPATAEDYAKWLKGRYPLIDFSWFNYVLAPDEMVFRIYPFEQIADEFRVAVRPFHLGALTDYRRVRLIVPKGVDVTYVPGHLGENQIMTADHVLIGSQIIEVPSGLFGK